MADPGIASWKGYVYAGMMFLVAQTGSILLHQYFHRASPPSPATPRMVGTEEEGVQVFLMGMHWRGIMVSAVFAKSLRLSNTARKDTTVGEIVNLMSVDAQRFQVPSSSTLHQHRVRVESLKDVTTYVCMMWSSPMQITLSLFFLWRILGPSVLAGLAVMILLMPLNFLLMSLMRKWSIEQMKHKVTLPHPSRLPALSLHDG